MIRTGPDRRLYFLDNLRAFIILLVVVFHVAMGYTTWDLKWWYVNDTQKSPFFDLFVLSTDVYIMPVMFLLAGYFAPAALAAKGVGGFWQNKLWRIVVPWVGGVLLFAPLIAYSAFYSRMPVPPPYLPFWTGDFFSKYYQQAHYWFLGILALFFVLFTLACLLRPDICRKQPQPGSPSAVFFLGFSLLSALPFFVANLFFWVDTWMSVKLLFMIQPVRIGLYACYFALGVHAWRNDWFTRGGYQPRTLPWVIAAAVMLVVFLVYRVMFTLPPEIPPLYKAGHALAFSFFCLTASFALIALFRRFVDSDAWLWRRLAANSYTIYFIHQFVIIPLAYTVQKSAYPIALKYIGVSAAALILCFLVSEYLIGPVLSIGRKSSPGPSRPL